MLSGYNKPMKKTIFAFAILSALAPSLASAACTSLSSDLATGSANAGGQVTALQNFLASSGYLSATPNGVFGPATAAALKKFQSANGIPATGSAGPLTRLAIQARSCSAASAPTPVPATPTPATASGLITALSPAAGEKLALGSTATVQWRGPAGTTYNVVLEDASSTRVGLIVAGTRASSYDWTVGQVQANGSMATVAPGTYRVHAEDLTQGPQSTDRLSGAFAITAPPITVSSALPQSGKGDGKTSVVLYGAGFGPSTSIDFSGYGQVAPLFVSPDGKVLVFQVPSGTFAGAHTYAAVNSYDNSDAKSRSADLQFVVFR